MSRLLIAWLHPVMGIVAVALVLRGGSLGLGTRRRGRRAVEARARHAAAMPRVLVLVLVTWLGGVGAVRFARADLEPGTSGHFQVGAAIAALLVVNAMVSRRVARAAWARQLHPLIGASALLLCGVQVFLGLQLLRAPLAWLAGRDAPRVASTVALD